MCTSHVPAAQVRTLPDAALIVRQATAVPSAAAMNVPTTATKTPARRTQSDRPVPSADGSVWATGGQYSTVPTIVHWRVIPA